MEKSVTNSIQMVITILMIDLSKYPPEDAENDLVARENEREIDLKVKRVLFLYQVNQP